MERPLNASLLVLAMGLAAEGLTVRTLADPSAGDLPPPVILEPATKATVLGNLGRDQALELLKTHGLPAFEVQVPIGDQVNLHVLISTLKQVDANQGRMLDAAYGTMQRLGYLSFRRSQQNAFGTKLVTYAIRPTKLELERGKVLQERHYGYPTVYQFRVTDRLPLEVTGIRMTGSTSRQVEFRYRLDENNPVFREMVRSGNTVRTGLADVSLYDDGWRITDVHLTN